MKELKRQSKEAQRIINAYERARNKGLWSLSCVYNSWSNAKDYAFNYCCDLMNKYEGYGLYITSYNTNIFTCAFKFSNAEGQECIYYITPSREVVVNLEV